MAKGSGSTKYQGASSASAAKSSNSGLSLPAKAWIDNINSSTSINNVKAFKEAALSSVGIISKETAKAITEAADKRINELKKKKIE